jgi:hypothetical protein
MIGLNLREDMMRCLEIFRRVLDAECRASLDKTKRGTAKIYSSELDASTRVAATKHGVYGGSSRFRFQIRSHPLRIAVGPSHSRKHSKTKCFL